MGDTPESACLAGVPSTRVPFAVHALAGLPAAIGGVLSTSRGHAGFPTDGVGYEVSAGRGARHRRRGPSRRQELELLGRGGAVIVGTLNNDGNLLAVNSYMHHIIGALNGAVAFDQGRGGRSRTS